MRISDWSSDVCSSDLVDRTEECVCIRPGILLLLVSGRRLVIVVLRLELRRLILGLVIPLIAARILLLLLLSLISVSGIVPVIVGILRVCRTVTHDLEIGRAHV